MEKKDRKQMTNDDTHYMRDMNAHLRNTWLWDEWGFTKNWGNKCTMSDMDGFTPFFAERRSHFLVVEMKHWDGQGDVPKVNRLSGQMKALAALGCKEDFTVILGYGDTSTRQVYYYELLTELGPMQDVKDRTFQEFIDAWFSYASGE
jgi:hypothetical protein